MSSTVPPITPRSANTSRAASSTRWRVASRRADRPCSPAGLAVAIGICLRLGLGTRFGRAGRRARAHRSSPAKGVPIQAAQSPGRCSRPIVTARSVARYIFVSDTLTYRIRVRILASAAVPCNPLLLPTPAPAARSGPSRRARPGRPRMFERLGSWTYRFRFLIVLAWIVAAVVCARFAPSLAGAGLHRPGVVPAAHRAVGPGARRPRAGVPRQHGQLVRLDQLRTSVRPDRRGPRLP